VTVVALARRLGRALEVRDARRFALLVGTLAVAQIRLRYLDAALSYVWAVARPTVFFAITWAIFSHVTDLDEGVRFYAAYLFLGIVLWTFFSEATATATGSLVQQGHLLRKIPVPPIAIPLATALTSLFDLAMSLVVVFAFALASGVRPQVGWLELPLLLVYLGALTCGVSMLLAIAYVRFRDIDHVWGISRQVLFYVSAIFYVVASLPNAVERLTLVNPVAVVLTQARHALLDESAPSAAEAAGGYLYLLPSLAIVIAVLVLGLLAFARTTPWLAERL